MSNDSEIPDYWMHHRVAPDAVQVQSDACWHCTGSQLDACHALMLAGEWEACPREEDNHE